MTLYLHFFSSGCTLTLTLTCMCHEITCFPFPFAVGVNNTDYEVADRGSRSTLHRNSDVDSTTIGSARRLEVGHVAQLHYLSCIERCVCMYICMCMYLSSRNYSVFSLQNPLFNALFITFDTLIMI